MNVMNDISPSQITHTRFLFWPPGSDDLEVEEGGKWMIFLNGRFDLLDVYWNGLRPLCDRGILYKIRATTALDKEGGLINCYTKNANDSREVGKAAVAIAEAINIETNIHYKTNRASEEGLFRRLGKTNISKYKFSVDKEFFERVSSTWIFAEVENMSETKIPEKEVIENSKKNKNVGPSHSEGRYESESASCLNWRTAKREDVCQDKRSHRNSSNSRIISDSNSSRAEGFTKDGYGRDTASQDRQRCMNKSNWRQNDEAECDFSRKKDGVSFEGNWSFLVEDEEKENLKEILQKLHEDNPNLFIKGPSEISYKRNGLSTVMYSTPDYRDIDTIKNSAEIINRVFHYPYSLTYFYKSSPIYIYTPNALFKSARRENTIAWISTDEVKTPISLTEEVNEISLDDAELPSTVMDRKCLFYPSESAVENLPSEAGKWMLYGSGDLHKLDVYWKKLKILCDEGVIAGLKISTAADARGGVLRAYTKDSDNKEQACLAGNAILEKTGYGELMYYKTNTASKDGKYKHEGKTNVSVYMHGGNFSFYFRDMYNRWELWQ